VVACDPLVRSQTGSLWRPRNLARPQPKVNYEIQEICIASCSQYLRRGWQVIQSRMAKKGRTSRGGKTSTRQGGSCRHFNKKTNIGIRLGKSSGDLIDVDLTAKKAVILAPYFLYRKPIAFTDANQSVPLITGISQKLRSARKNSMTLTEHVCLNCVLPDSKRFVPPQYIRPVSGYMGSKRKACASFPKKLLRALKRQAAACILARHWPKKGTRNQATLALAESYYVLAGRTLKCSFLSAWSRGHGRRRMENSGNATLSTRRSSKY